MFNKYYEKIKHFIIENYLILLFYLVFIATLTYKLPYYILTGGGIIDTSSRVEIKDGYESEGSFNFAYVSQLYATIPTYLLSKVMPDWTLESIEDYQINEEESDEELLIRDKLYLEEANTAAIFNAYNMAGKNINITKENLHIIYIDDKRMNDLKIGDILINIDGESIESLDDVKEIVNNKNIGDTLNLEVLRNGKQKEVNAVVYEKNNQKLIGISLITTYTYEVEPEFTLSFENRESGPSGGLTLALTIYDKLIEEDLTGGMKIVGTGTIDIDGNVGSIGGVTYKLKGAVDATANIFLVPNGENYEDCIKSKKENNYNIKIIGIDSFEDAISKLRELK